MRICVSDRKIINPIILAPSALKSFGFIAQNYCVGSRFSATARNVIQVVGGDQNGEENTAHFTYRISISVKLSYVGKMCMLSAQGNEYQTRNVFVDRWYTKTDGKLQRPLSEDKFRLGQGAFSAGESLVYGETSPCENLKLRSERSWSRLWKAWQQNIIH